MKVLLIFRAAAIGVLTFTSLAAIGWWTACELSAANSSPAVAWGGFCAGLTGMSRLYASQGKSKLANVCESAMWWSMYAIVIPSTVAFWFRIGGWPIEARLIFAIASAPLFMAAWFLTMLSVDSAPGADAADQ